MSTQTAPRLAGNSPAGELASARRVATAMDSSVPLPVIRYRIGVDVIVGLLPVVGDWVAACCSLYVVLVGYRLGASSTVLGLMLLRIGVEFVLGSVPVFGSILDAVWRVNERNVDHLEAHLGVDAASPA